LSVFVFGKGGREGLEVHEEESAQESIENPVGEESCRGGHFQNP
jgi:hypothetical protein